VNGCNLCGGNDWVVMEIHQDTRVVRCVCGLVFVSPVPPRPAIEAAYSQAYYDAWSSQSRARHRIWKRRLSLITAHVKRPGRLLDVGCGDGAFLRLARRHGWEVTGTELSSAAPDADNVEIRRGEVWEAALGPDSYDVVTSWHVIEHAADPKRMVQEIYRLLKPEGRLILATPNLNDYVFRCAYMIGRLKWPSLYEEDERELHLFHFTADTLRRLVSSAGFVDIQVGFDRGAAAVRGKQLVNAVAYGWYRATGWNWGIGLELTARKPACPSGISRCEQAA
jgi:SAM-dependent methyltransferase